MIKNIGKKLKIFNICLWILLILVGKQPRLTSLSTYCLVQCVKYQTTWYNTIYYWITHNKAQTYTADANSLKQVENTVSWILRFFKKNSTPSGCLLFYSNSRGQSNLNGLTLQNNLGSSLANAGGRKRLYILYSSLKEVLEG